MSNKSSSEAFSQPKSITFDEILPVVQQWLKENHESLKTLLNHEDDWLLINRDLNGRVRFILPEHMERPEHQQDWNGLVSALMGCLGKHVYPQINNSILFESSREMALQGATSYLVEGMSKVWIVDRLATEANWSRIEPETDGVPRIVFFSIKGGVGRSTALAATAWHLAQAGKRVLVLDLDLESPGLSMALLPLDRQPKYGITDWLVEDLVDNGDIVFSSMVAASNLSHDGEIHVVPAHGANHGEYISKLGRVWMSKLREDRDHVMSREIWSSRLNRLIQNLENSIQPDIILIDSRSGMDEISSACMTELGAHLILLFALEGEQTWNGYRMLFEQWLRAGVAEEIRERLQVVGALIPELDRIPYLMGLRQHSYDVFQRNLYDEIEPGSSDGWSFDEADDTAPHYPWKVNWHRGFAGLRSLHGRLIDIDHQEVESVFGGLITGIKTVVDGRAAT